MPTRTLSVIFCKEDIPRARPLLRGAVAVVIDVLRAGSTMVTALANGARRLQLAASPQEARRIAAAFLPGVCLLGGERGGLRIAGFDLGNSPHEYSEERVRGKRIVLTTTNGTAALQACASAGARRILIGCLLNAPAAARAALAFKQNIILVCAGTDGLIGLDDVFAAGAMADVILAQRAWQGDDSALIAQRVFLTPAKSKKATGVLETLRQSAGGRNLARVELEDDLLDCVCSHRVCQVVPTYTISNNLVSLLHKP